MPYWRINADEAVRQFQKGELRESDQEWHKMVPKEAIEAFGKQEVQRQSVIFEVFKAERDYVADLRSIQDVWCLCIHLPLLLLTQVRSVIYQRAKESAISDHQTSRAPEFHRRSFWKPK